MSEPTSKARVQLGCCVEIEFVARSGECECLEFDLVPDQQADYQAGFLGVSTPLAQAILGEKAGITVPYFTDELMGIKIISIRESNRNIHEDTVAQRKAALKDAIDQIEFKNAVLFAASMNTKWGSYDADGLDFEGWKSQQSTNSSETEQENKE